jgi:hypothetical protein
MYKNDDDILRLHENVVNAGNAFIVIFEELLGVTAA